MGRKIKISNNESSVTYQEALTAFIKYCRLKNLSERTLSFYEETIGVFAKFKGTEDFVIAEITKEEVEKYILHLKSQRIKSVSVNTRIRGLRAFLYFCMERGYLESFKINLIKQEQVIKDTYTDGEMVILLQKPDLKHCSFTEYRNWAMVNFMIATGIRISTLIAIRIKDIDLEGGMFKTKHNKSRREQVIPIARALNKALTEYLTYRQYKEDEEYLFCNQYGEKLTAEACKVAISRYGQRKGVQANCHKFRHTFAKNWILSGGDPFRLQNILGHSSMEMTRKYVNIYGNELQKDFDRFNMLDRLSQDKSVIKMKNHNNF